MMFIYHCPSWYWVLLGIHRGWNDVSCPWQELISTRMDAKLMDNACLTAYNGLLPGRYQATIWISAKIFLIRPMGTNFIEILIEMHTFSVMKMYSKMSSWKRRPFYLGLNALTMTWLCMHSGLPYVNKDTFMHHSPRYSTLKDDKWVILFHPLWNPFKLIQQTHPKHYTSVYSC